MGTQHIKRLGTQEVKYGNAKISVILPAQGKQCSVDVSWFIQSVERSKQREENANVSVKWI